MASVAKRTWTHKGETKQAWVVRYSEGEKHRSRQFDRKKDADAFRATVEVEKLAARRGGPRVEPRTVRHTAALFLEELSIKRNDGRLSGGRVRNLETTMRISVIPNLGSRIISEVSSSEVEQLYPLLRQAGLSAATAKERLFHLSLLFDFAERRGYATDNPALKALRQFRGLARKPIAVPTESEVRKLMAESLLKPGCLQHRTTKALACAVHIAAFCGLRWGEIAALKALNLDFSNKVLKVRHSLSEIDGLKGPKTKAGIRDVPMPPIIARMLIEYIQEYPARGDLVFTTRTGAPLRHNDFHVAWKRLLARAKLSTDYHFHSLRHFASSWAIANHVPITDVALLQGHANVDTTLMIYAHPLLTAGRRSEAYDAMAARLSQPEPAPATQELRMA